MTCATILTTWLGQKLLPKRKEFPTTNRLPCLAARLAKHRSAILLLYPKHLQKVVPLGSGSLLINRAPHLPRRERQASNNTWNSLPVSWLSVRWRLRRLVRVPRASGMGPAQRQQWRNIPKRRLRSIGSSIYRSILRHRQDTSYTPVQRGSLEEWLTVVILGQELHGALSQSVDTCFAPPFCDT